MTRSSAAHATDTPPPVVAHAVTPLILAAVDGEVLPSFDVEAWAQHTAQPGDWFDVYAADHVETFFRRYLKHTKGEWAGQAFILIGWQRALVRTLFGWKRADGKRRFRKLYLAVARKNGKTALAAGLALYLAFAAGEIGAEVYCAATTKDQAKICFTEALRMRSQSPVLKARTDAFKYSIVAPSSFAKLEVLSSDHGNKDGLNVSAFVGDEFHAWKERLFYDVLRTAQGARREPMEILITTYGVDEDSLWGEEHDYAEKVRDGELDDRELLPVIFAANENDPIDSADTWAKANPSLGVTISREYVAKEARKALTSPAYLNTFKRLHLNMKTKQQTVWLPPADVDACNLRPVTLEALAGRTCNGGLDLGSINDLTALVLAFEPLPGEDIIDLWMHCWMPKADLAARIKNDRVPYDKWAAAGLITLTDGNVTDYDAIRLRVSGRDSNGNTNDDCLVRKVHIVDLARDRWNAAHLTTQLMGDGVNMIEFGQGYASMSAPAKEMEARVLKHTLNHGGNPVFIWMAKAVSITTDPAGNIKPVKPDRKKSKVRIDGVVAGIMALARFCVRQAPPDIDGFLANPART